MKRLLLFLLPLVFLAACQKEVADTLSGIEPTNPSGTGGSGTFTAKIDGVAWTADRGAFAHFGVAANGIPAIISIFGLGTDKKIVGLSLVDSGVHTYTFTADDLNAGIFQDSSLPDVNSFASLGAPTQPSGTANITSIDRDKKTVSGTFSFIAYRELDGQQRNITDGVFTNIPYTENSGLPSASTSDTFTVKIDGTYFQVYSVSALKVDLTNTISVTGGDQQGVKNVSIVVPPTIAPGTYTLGTFGADYMGIYNTGAGTLTSINGGTLQILEHNTTTKRIRGTFTFKGEDILSVLPSADLTEGYFSATYQ